MLTLERPAQMKSYVHRGEVPGDRHLKIRNAVEAADLIADRTGQFGDDLYTETVEIGPNAAAYILLEHTLGNRPVRRNRVQQVMRSLRAGTWKLTSQGISFDKEGKLNNGHHRLHGVVLSDESMVTRVTWGEERSVFDVLDTGSGRSPGDIVSIAGHKNGTSVAATIRLLNFIHTGQQRLLGDQVVVLLDRYRGIAEITVASRNLAKVFNMSPAPLGSALYLIRDSSRESHRIPEFCELLLDGSMLAPTSPLKFLRDGLLMRKFQPSAHHHLRQMAIAACFIKAWNSWVSGENVKVLVWKSNEAFPKVV